MAKPQNDSFLPSGAYERTTCFNSVTGHSPMTSPPNTLQRRVPDYIPNSFQLEAGSHFSPKPYFPTHSPFAPTPQHQTTLHSPPISRSGSTGEDSSAQLIEDWRKYTDNLREQFRGERAHLIADRARADEIMAEEREINDQERILIREENAGLRTQNQQLLAKLAAYESKYGPLDNIECATTSPLLQPQQQQQQHTIARTGIVSPGLSFLNRPVTSPPPRPVTEMHKAAIDEINDGLPMVVSPRTTPPREVPQESGREADGKPVWAPESGPAARTFEHNNAVEMDLNQVPTVDALRVPTREFRPEDFQRLTPEEQKAKDVAASETSSVVGDGVPGGNISPHLDGVTLRSEAVAPSFRIKSPSASNTPISSPPSNSVMPVPSAIVEKQVAEIQAPGAVNDVVKDEPSADKPVAEVETADTVDDDVKDEPSLKSSGDAAPAFLIETTNHEERPSRHNSEGRQTASELLKATENDRLTANAGSTPLHGKSPSHSRTISVVSDDYLDSGNPTPTQNRERQKDRSFDNDFVAPSNCIQLDGPIHENAVIDEESLSDVEDEPLASPLAMGHKNHRGESFSVLLSDRLKALAEEQARRGSVSSVLSTLTEEGTEKPSEPRVTSGSNMVSPTLEDDDDVKPLRLKASSNFGMAFGRAPSRPSF